MYLENINILISASHLLVSLSVIERTNIGYISKGCTTKTCPNIDGYQYVSRLLAKPDIDCVSILVLEADIADQMYWYWLAKLCLIEDISIIFSKIQVSPTLRKPLESK
jgi:hypothetical protein